MYFRSWEFSDFIYSPPASFFSSALRQEPTFLTKLSISAPEDR
jgi:hypothetical protein